MTLTNTNTRPPLGGEPRRQEARKRRHESEKLSAERPLPTSGSNEEELQYGSAQPTSFTKGLSHDAYGLVSREDYERFVSAIVTPDTTLTDVHIAAEDPDMSKYRRWESPLAGHYFENQGPDPDAVAMAPAPKLGRSELCAEMAVLYVMALVRDLSFEKLSDPTTTLKYSYPPKHPRAGTSATATATVGDLVDELRKLSWFDPNAKPVGFYGKHLTRHETQRRAAAWDGSNGLTVETLFRGSTAGAKKGPYISQFMLLGAGAKPLSGIIPFGAQAIDQKVMIADDKVDFMTDWAGWLQVQNGHKPPSVNHSGARWITSPRDLATYVHFDQLYQAYFNACLILLESGFGKHVDAGAPITRKRGHAADGFATWGGPHVLSLLTEVASRALRAVRRQKFQIHRRARPEVLAARLTQTANGATLGMDNMAITALRSMLKELGEDDPTDIKRPGVLLHWIAEHNTAQNKTKGRDATDKTVVKNDSKNFLLPMAFSEGSPMHPAYGAGHATVAGACVTILKAFFESEIPLADVFEGVTDFQLVKTDGKSFTSGVPFGDTTVAEELDKLAANISIGRNMAGVHYYSDYYDSLRMGERIAAGILEEQMLDYTEPLQLSFKSYDGDDITIGTNGGSTAAAVMFMVNGDDNPAARDEWWLRHVREYGTGTLQVASAQVAAA